MSHAHVEWSLLRPLHLSHFQPLHLSHPFALPTAFHLHLPWCRGLQPRALPLRTSVTWTSTTPPQVLSSTTNSSRRLLSSSTRSPWPSSSSLKTSTTMTSPSVRRFFNACRRRADHSEGEGLSSCLLSSSMSHDRTGRPVVCRDASHAQGHEIQRQDSLKANRLGLCWTDKESKSSLIFKQRFKGTNSRLIMTEEVHQN